MNTKKWIIAVIVVILLSAAGIYLANKKQAPAPASNNNPISNNRQVKEKSNGTVVTYNAKFTLPKGFPEAFYIEPDAQPLKTYSKDVNGMNEVLYEYLSKKTVADNYKEFKAIFAAQGWTLANSIQPGADSKSAQLSATKGKDTAIAALQVFPGSTGKVDVVLKFRFAK